jgi:2-haloacid dehalogenase
VTGGTESHTGSMEPAARPAVLVFDVNETLSDLSPLADRFAEVGLDRMLVRAWFAAVLRDGMALAVHGERAPFADLVRESLRSLFHVQGGERPSGERSMGVAVEHVMAGFLALPVHPDVVDGVRELSAQGLRLVTMSNGAASVAERLLEEAGIAGAFEHLLSVEQAGYFKPDARAYRHAVEICGVAPHEAMLVAVHPWDTDGARRAGLSSAWINRGDGDYPAYFLSPTLAAGSLTGLADQLA